MTWTAQGFAIFPVKNTHNDNNNDNNDIYSNHLQVHIAQCTVTLMNTVIKGNKIYTYPTTQCNTACVMCIMFLLIIYGVRIRDHLNMVSWGSYWMTLSCEDHEVPIKLGNLFCKDHEVPIELGTSVRIKKIKEVVPQTTRL